VASAQHELGMKFGTLCAWPTMQIYKYCIHNVAHSYGKTATFMPKPIYGDNGSGMHVHQSIWKGGKPVFAGNKYADLSEMCLYYIGGIIKHAKALNAFTNPLDQLLQAPGPGLRGAGAARLFGAQPLGLLPHPVHDLARRPSASRSASPIRRQPLPRLRGDADGRPRRHQEQDPSGRRDGQGPLRPAAGGAEEDPDRVRLAARGAAENLDKDRAFLKAGGVFDDDFIDSYIELKMTEVIRFEHTPHPVEFEMYYSVAAASSRPVRFMMMSSRCRNRSVSTEPGLTVLTCTPSRLPMSASAFMNASCAPITDAPIM
jgi:glutamine synthetase